MDIRGQQSRGNVGLDLVICLFLFLCSSAVGCPPSQKKWIVLCPGTGKASDQWQPVGNDQQPPHKESCFLVSLPLLGRAGAACTACASL